jgi:hypothetical protein
MTALLLAVVLLAAFEWGWARSAALRPYRAHFRGMLALFWGVMLAVFALGASGAVPQMFFQGTPRFASDALTYHGQAMAVASQLTQGNVGVLMDREVFGYSRVLAVVYAIFGSAPPVGNVFNAVFFLASTISVFLIGRELFGPRVGLWAAWGLAVTPTLLLHYTQTLRWGLTSAALHLAVLGTVLLVSRRGWHVPFLIAILGFAALATDLPHVARLFALVGIAYAGVLFADRSLGRARFAWSARVGALAATALFAYYVAWMLPARASGAARTGDLAWDAAAGSREELRTPRRARIAGDPATTVVGSIGTYLDETIEPALLARDGFVRDAEVLRRAGIPLGTAMTGRSLRDFPDFLSNLPAAFAVALFEPTPVRLLQEGGGVSRLRGFAAAEVTIYYATLVLSAVGFVLAARTGGAPRSIAVYLVLLTAGAYALLGTVILNGGTLHRMRQPYLAVHWVFAAAAVVWLLSAANASGSSHTPVAGVKSP